MITLDTNAVIYYFEGQKQTTDLIDKLRSNNENFVISTITELELFSLANLTEEDKIRINLWLNQIYILPVDSVVAHKAAEFRRDYRLKTPDAIIAATAMLNGGKLITRDIVFKRIKNLEIL